MLTTARPIFENVPAAYADPVGLADQQAPGVVSLVVVRYEPADGHDHDALGPVYDAYVAVSGQLVAVARTTADYRYPVTPAVALSRFIEHRDGGHPAFLSVYELSEDDCARFVETAFYSECLKLHVDGAASAELVARQVARSSCGGGLPPGVLEVNDFSRPGDPRIRLIDLDALAAPSDTPADAGGTAGETLEPDAVDPVALADALADVLDGVTGRVLLYDRAKNRAALPHRAGKPFDLEAAVEQAGRLADARRSADPALRPLTAAGVPPAAVPDEHAERVEAHFQGLGEHADAVAPDPHRFGLAALVAELQGGPPAPPSPAFDPTDAPTGGGSPAPLDDSAGDGPAGTPPTAPQADPPSSEVSVVHDAGPVAPMPPPPADATGAAVRTPATAPSPALPGNPRHVLATELDVLRAGVYALFEDAVGRDKAVAHERHVLDEHAIASPVSPADTVGYLRALLTGDPPKRWHGYKRARGKTYGDVCTKLLAFHTANAHVDSPAVHHVGQLWARLCK